MPTTTPRWHELADHVLDGGVISAADALAILDSSDPELMEVVAAASRLRFQHFSNTVKVNYLVNNAGAGAWAPVHATSDAMLDEVLAMSLRAPFRLSREVLPHMGMGCAIVTIGSTFGIMGGLDGGIYCAVKAGLTGLTQTMAAQYGEQGIRSNVVAPTVVKTPMTEAAWDYPSFQRINQGLTPFYRDCLPEDVANAVAFLCSAKGEFINGQVLPIDGGWSTTRMINSKFQ